VETKEHLNLIKDFPLPTWEEWKQTVIDSLKGADYDKVMYTKTYEGITLKPIYLEADSKALPFIEALPGEAPYQRGNDPEHYINYGWKVAQAQTNPDLKALNKEILDELSRGLNMVNLLLAHDDYPEGIKIQSAGDLKSILKDVVLAAAPLMIQMDVDDPDIFVWLDEMLHGSGVDIRNLDGCLGYDPTGEFARKGHLNLPLETVWEIVCNAVIQRANLAPKMRCLSIDATVYEASGASSSQELAFALSTAIGYIQGLIMEGMDIDTVAPLFQVKLSIGSNFFMEIAKIRAFRMMWSEMIKAFGGSGKSQKIWIHGKTARFNKSTYDLYVNMLRTSTEGFAAVIGGVDSLEIDRFDAVLVKKASEFSKRIARNQQLILAEEAHFGKVVDAAGGCYYIESLTSELATLAWKIMQEIETAGGMIRSLKAGLIHDMIERVASARIDAVHKRRDVFVGVNMYANPDDTLTELTEIKIDQSKAAVSLERGALPKRRAVAALESFRSRILASKKSVFLLTMGTLAEYKARADFSSGFFQVGGFQVITGTGYTGIDAAIEAARGYDAICICSTDEKYPALVPALCEKLQGKTLILAGYPADMVESYKAQGIDIFIHIRANVLDTLKELAHSMGVNQ